MANPLLLFRRTVLLCFVAGLMGLPVKASWAGIGASGDVNPANPATWTSSTSANIGQTTTGSLTLTSGSTVTSGFTYVGKAAGAVGTVSVSGAGSQWTAQIVEIGVSGSGTLNISGGGTFVCPTAWLAYAQGGTGTATVTGSGSSWTSTNVVEVGGIGAGTLIINLGGTVTSGGGSVGSSTGSTGTVLVDGVGSNWTATTYDIIVGQQGHGYLSITNGATVSGGIDMANGSGSSATLILDGAGSKLTQIGDMYIGQTGTGILKITNGAVLSSSSNTNNIVAGSVVGTGFITVDGVGSTFSGSSRFDLGSVGKNGGHATLLITNGGSVSTSIFVLDNSASLLFIDIGHGSNLTCSSNGGFSSNGTVRFAAAPGTAPGTYTPITAAGTWSGLNTYQALGGKWNSSNHTFTVAAPLTGTSGNGVTIDTSVNQQVVITGPAGNTVEAGFQGTTTSAQLTFTATTMTGGTLTGLETLLGSSSQVMAGWQFIVTGSGYTSGNPVYLSMDIGSGFSADNLDIWHFDGTNWTPYTTTDFSYDGTNANFTVTGFSGYAVVETPEPATMMLLGIGSGLVLLRRRRAV